MKRLEILLDETLRGRGHSGGLVFDHYDGTISTASTNEGGRPRINMVIVDLYPISLITKNLEIRIIGGPKERAEWEQLPHTEKAFTDFMWSMFLRAINHETMSDLLSNAIQVGRADGIKTTQAALREVIGL